MHLRSLRINSHDDSQNKYFFFENSVCRMFIEYESTNYLPVTL